MLPDVNVCTDRIRLRTEHDEPVLFAALKSLGYRSDAKRGALLGVSEKTVGRWRNGGPVRDPQMALVVRVMTTHFSAQLSDMGITPSLDTFFEPYRGDASDQRTAA
jgi:hypothetical protein